MAGGDWKEMLIASQTGDLELVRYHVSMGEDPNYQHPEFMTGPLIESVRFGNLDIAQFLLEHGADPTIKEGFGTDTPLSIAREANNRAAIKLLYPYLDGKGIDPKEIITLKVLVTGGNRGIGKEIARELLQEDHEVCIVSRDLAKGTAAVKELQAATGNSKVAVLEGDLSSIKKCKTLVEKIKSEFGEINVMINNAGVWMTEKKQNEDQLELSFMVNYLAPYILCKGLKTTLEKNQPARIINVNSGLYVKGKLNLATTPSGKDFSVIKTYATSKFCNVLFTIDFAEELEGSGITINAVHPGVINTGLGDSPKLLSKIVKLVKRFWKPPSYGAKAPVWLATSDEVAGINGQFYNENQIMAYHKDARNKSLRSALRIKTEEIIS